jgi:hypothetical protein
MLPNHSIASICQAPAQTYGLPVHNSPEKIVRLAHKPTPARCP